MTDDVDLQYDKADFEDNYWQDRSSINLSTKSKTGSAPVA